MNKEQIIKKQLVFHKRGKAGCAFSSIAARKPDNYEWEHKILCSYTTKEIDEAIEYYIQKEGISTVSLMFPTIRTVYDLCSLIQTLENCKNIITIKTDYQDFQCFGFRVKVEDKLSWVTGFGSFSFFPKTRQTPFTEIAFRVKQKPQYEWEMKESPAETLHLAHMNMQDMEEDTFKDIWQHSLNNTEKILGHKPDFISAAKTTFSIPKTI